MSHAYPVNKNSKTVETKMNIMHAMHNDTLPKTADNANARWLAIAVTGLYLVTMMCAYRLSWFLDGLMIGLIYGFNCDLMLASLASSVRLSS